MMDKRYFVLSLVILFLVNVGLVHAEVLVSDANVSYESEIVDGFEDSGLVSVIVEIKDITNITISRNDPVELQNMKDEERKKILSNITNSVLLTLSEDEFKIRNKESHFFSGNITEKGFDKLILDERIGNIYFNGVSHITLSESRPLINADDVENDLDYNGTGSTICVIDSGIDYTYSDLGGCSSTNNISDGSCDKVIAGWDYVNNDANPMDDNGHGTNVAGIIVSQNQTYRGISPNVSVYVVNCNENGSYEKYYKLNSPPFYET